MQFVTTCKRGLFQQLLELFLCISNIYSMHFLLIPACGKFLSPLFMLLFVVAAREKPHWCPFLTDWTRAFFCRKMEKTRPVKKEMEGEVFISRQSRHYPFIDNGIRELFAVSTLIWRVNIYVSRQGKV